MRTIYMIIPLLFFAAAPITTHAQKSLPRENRRPVLVDDLNRVPIFNIRQNLQFAGLNDEQRAQIEKYQMEMQKGITQLDNQLHEKQVHLQTLETQGVVNMKAINKNIDEQAKLLAKQMKLKAEYKQKIRAILNDEQRGRFDAGKDE